MIPPLTDSDPEWHTDMSKALAQDEKVGFSGLTESEIEQTMSVKGIS